MDRQRWEHIKALRPAEPRYLHVSAEIIRNPQAVLAAARKKPFFGPQFVVGRTHTFNEGRNKVKREKCKIHKQWT